MSAYQIQLVGKNPLTVTREELRSLSIERLNSRLYHSVNNNRSYQAEIQEIDEVNKLVTLSVNGITYECQIRDSLDLMIKSMDMTSKNKTFKKDLISSMPGLVVSIEVSEGQEVEEGTTLMILEAMKMENILKAGSSGVITKIHCQPKDSVDKGQLLIEIE